jgi:hypothetical protein
MKYSRSNIESKASAVPELKFENQSLTSFAGLVIFQKFFAMLQLKARLRACFRSLSGSPIYRHGTLFLQLIVHFLLGFRELQDARHYQDDPLVKRVLGLNRLPDVATLSRMLRNASPESVARLRALLIEMVLVRLELAQVVRITLDFDGSVLSTRRHAEGTAVGYNKKRKGARSYYPLFCTVAQTGQVLDFLHRPGNVHDSNGAKAFILQCVAAVRAALPGVYIEVRVDSAFFSDEIVMALADADVEFTMSVPFERFVELKKMIEARRKWHTLDSDTSYFEMPWKPQVWQERFRFLFIRTRSRQQQKGPIQLDLFVPHEYGYEFKVIVTNKILEAQHTVAYHEGRGSQEGVFAELKSHCNLGYVPVRTLYGNQTYLLAGLFAHNLTRELQMQIAAPSRGTTRNRATLWVFEKLDTVRKTVIQRAGRFTLPQGVLTLTISASSTLKARLLQTLGALGT